LNKEGEIIYLIVKYICPEEVRTKRGNLKYFDELRQLAKQNRNNPTEAERMLWKELKKLEYPFLRQKPMLRFILDFYCSKLLLVIEVDGDFHIGRKNYDDGRDEILKNIGIKTIRFKNEDVLNNLSSVMKQIKSLFPQRGI